jgi:hypothetical protein
MRRSGTTGILLTSEDQSLVLRAALLVTAGRSLYAKPRDVEITDVKVLGPVPHHPLDGGLVDAHVGIEYALALT